MMEELENPFLENDKNLLYLDTKDIAKNIVCDTVDKIEPLEKQKYQEFLTETLVTKTKTFDDTVYKNNLSLFSYKPSLQSKHSTFICNFNPQREREAFYPNCI